jgi:hypothetical protein
MTFFGFCFQFAYAILSFFDIEMLKERQIYIWVEVCSTGSQEVAGSIPVSPTTYSFLKK